MNNRIIIVIAIVATASTFAIGYAGFENNILEKAKADELQARVHAFTDNGTKYVKIADLMPNSALIFVYPYTGSALDTSVNSHWILIRLPSKLGGNKDDISSFRAYNMRDITFSACMLSYSPELEKLHEPCNNGEYDPVNGTAIVGLATQNEYKALPMLDLGLDDDGYIYVKPPTFELDKNGVIGAGREIQNDS